jgi:mannose/fructose/N-acetylgalactosamine-specific phosphotransferase system component IID
MHLVALGWIYVVLMMALAEALAPSGTVLGAIVTFLLYGVLPLSLVLYLMATPMRRKRRLRDMAKELAQAQADAASAADPDSRSQPPRDAVATERKEA